MISAAVKTLVEQEVDLSFIAHVNCSIRTKLSLKDVNYDTMLPLCLEHDAERRLYEDAQARAAEIFKLALVKSASIHASEISANVIHWQWYDDGNRIPKQDRSVLKISDKVIVLVDPSSSNSRGIVGEIVDMNSSGPNSYVYTVACTGKDSFLKAVDKEIYCSEHEIARLPN